MMFVQENEETMPTGTDVWSNVTGKMLICPTAGKKIANAYGYNGTLENKGLGEIKEPTETMLSSDAEGMTDNLITKPEHIVARHVGAVIASYVDGHVSLCKGAVGYTIQDMTPTAPTTDFTTIPNAAFYKVNTGVAPYQGLSGILALPSTDPLVMKAPETGYSVDEFSGLGTSYNLGANAAGGMGVLIYTFPEAVSGDFAIAFDLTNDSGGNVAMSFGAFNEALAPICGLHHWNNGSGATVNGISSTLGAYGTYNTGVDSAKPFFIGTAHVVMSRIGSKVTIAFNGAGFNFTINYPKDLTGFTSQGDQMAALKYFYVFGYSGIHVSNIQLMR